MSPDGDPYLAALRLLSRRELTEAQLRQRLERRQYEAHAIDVALGRLKESRALDDRRAAVAIARHELVIRRRGRLRARRALAEAGVPPSLADEAIAAASADVDTDLTLRLALASRWPDGEPIVERRDYARLYRFLTGRGFEPDRVLALLDRRRRSGAPLE